MVSIIKDLKINRFINKLTRSIDESNELKQGYAITSLTRKNKFDKNGSSLQRQLVIEKDLSENGYVYFYSLKKIVSIPIDIDVSTMTIEKIEYDFDELKQVLKSNKVKNYNIVNSRTAIIEHPTIFASKGRAYVTSGLETDYIYPVVKQNNPDSPISDENLNAIIKDSKNATEFLENNDKLVAANSNTEKKEVI